MTSSSPRIITDYLVRVDYLCIEIGSNGARNGGSGFCSMWLSELRNWLQQRPGTMIVAISLR